MQYVRNLSDSVSTAWNSINPATLSGAIDVIVVEQEDGSLMCSPFHVRFGKFSLLRPYEKKVEFKVNGVRQNYSMKLGEGGEAFFVFETTDNIPQSMQTSPISSPAGSPLLDPQASSLSLPLQEPELLALDSNNNSIGNDPAKPRSGSCSGSAPNMIPTVQQKNGLLTPLSASPESYSGRPKLGDWSAMAQRTQSDDVLRQSTRRVSVNYGSRNGSSDDGETNRSRSPPPLSPREAMERAMTLSKELAMVDIPSRVTESGDLMLDMTGFKDSEADALRAEILARRVLSNELQGNYDVGALFGMDEQGNLWIYSSEEAKEAAVKRMMESPSMDRNPTVAVDAASDPGYHSDDSSASAASLQKHPHHRRAESDFGQGRGGTGAGAAVATTSANGNGSSNEGRNGSSNEGGNGSSNEGGNGKNSTEDAGAKAASTANTPPSSPRPAGDPNRNYAKTLRLTSDQLKALDLRPGENKMSFTVNRATCSAYMYLWKNEIPVVISDIDGTITKSDALGHVLNMIGRDWTHTGVAKLYSDITANGYNIMYLTSRSVGQADSTRTYLRGILQNGYRLPHGPTILSPDRTMAALRREIYLRKPEVFKMATLRDIRNLYGSKSHPFYAGFGNRLTDQISYRTVDVPRNRIFTINANAEVSLDLLSLNQLKLTYVNITEVVDHYFPPVSTLVKGGGEDYTDFKYWRDPPLELDEFSASDSEDENEAPVRRGRTGRGGMGGIKVEEDEDEEEEEDEEDDEDDEDLEDEEDEDEEDEDDDLEDDEEDEEGYDVEEDDELEGEEVGEDLGDSYLEGSVASDDAAVTEGDEDGEAEAVPFSAGLPVPPAAHRSVSVSEQTENTEATSSTVEDVSAEVITGVENLSVERAPSRADDAAE